MPPFLLKAPNIPACTVPGWNQRVRPVAVTLGRADPCILPAPFQWVLRSSLSHNSVALPGPPGAYSTAFILRSFQFPFVTWCSWDLGAGMGRKKRERSYYLSIQCMQEPFVSLNPDYIGSYPTSQRRELRLGQELRFALGYVGGKRKRRP